MANNVKTGKKITFKPVVTKPGDVATTLEKIDDLMTVEVYEGYRKLGRFKLSDAKLKFR